MHQKLTFCFVSMMALIVFGAAGAGSASSERVLRVRDGKVISAAQMFREIRQADLVFVGERHGSERDHAVQLTVISALHEADIPMAVGLEMFRADSQRDLDQWTEGKTGLDRFLKIYYTNWNMPWPLYGPIFLYAREHTIPMIGLNLPEGIVKKVAQKGFAGLSPEERRLLPPGISCSVDSSYMDFIRRVYGEHGEGKSFFSFCEAQVVWDKSMAFRLVEYLKKNKGRTVAVLAGVGHSWKRGIPEQVRELSKYRSVVIMPDVPEQTGRRAVTTADADYLVLD